MRWGRYFAGAVQCSAGGAGRESCQVGPLSSGSGAPGSTIVSSSLTKPALSAIVGGLAVSERSTQAFLCSVLQCTYGATATLFSSSARCDLCSSYRVQAAGFTDSDDRQRIGEAAIQSPVMRWTGAQGLLPCFCNRSFFPVTMAHSLRFMAPSPRSAIHSLHFTAL